MAQQKRIQMKDANACLPHGMLKRLEIAVLSGALLSVHDAFLRRQPPDR